MGGGHCATTFAAYCMSMKIFDSEISTVVLPFQINKRKRNIWKDKKELSSTLEQELKSFQLGINFVWKQFEDNNQNGVSVDDAFENQYLDLFHRNFTPEVAGNIYGDSKKLTQFIATPENSLGEVEIENGVLGFVKEANRIGISSCDGKCEILSYIRKIYIVATVFGSCLLVVEMYENKRDGVDEQVYWDIEEICSKLGIKSNDKLKIAYPTNCYPYVAKLLFGKFSKNETKYDKMSICRMVSIDEDDINKNEENMQKEMLIFLPEHLSVLK